jgi:uncharacterized protein (TIGR02996 family)
MTDEEALTLKPGDLVCRLKGHAKFVVDEVRDEGGEDGARFRVFVRRQGYRQNGRRYPREGRLCRWLRLVKHYDHVTANVYADWLDDRGEARAADLPRRAFPLDPGVRATA